MLTDELITAFQNTPQLNNLKNDYSIWGSRVSISGEKIPIHYRYAIDLKPERYISLNITEEDLLGYEDLNLTSQVSIRYDTNNYDWRELIYQMALDYYKYNQLDCYATRLAEANRDKNLLQIGEEPLYQNGMTGYEQYYIDLQGFWRQLYNITLDDENYYSDGEYKYWSKTLKDNPSQLNFWFDFLDSKNNELNQFSVPVVGDRAKAINEDSITAIYFREVPNLIFTTYQDYLKSELKDEGGYTPVFVNGNLEGMFNISAQGKSAQDRLNELLYNHSYCIESISLSSIPIYHLQPNTRIFVNDDLNNINNNKIR